MVAEPEAVTETTDARVEESVMNDESNMESQPVEAGEAVEPELTEPSTVSEEPQGEVVSEVTDGLDESVE